MGASDEPGGHAAGVVDGEHDPVPEGVDEGAAGGWFGEPGCLDLAVVVAEAAQVIGERAPPAGAYPMCQCRAVASVMPRLVRYPGAQLPASWPV
jgi:hypothetical protein